MTFYFKSKVVRRHRRGSKQEQEQLNKPTLQILEKRSSRRWSFLSARPSSYHSKNLIETDCQYFEIQLQKIELSESNRRVGQFVKFSLRNITAIIKNQQKQSDRIYQDAIEANFSHEQMNPLNSILANSNVVYGRLKLML